MLRMPKSSAAQLHLSAALDLLEASGDRRYTGLLIAQRAGCWAMLGQMVLAEREMNRALALLSDIDGGVFVTAARIYGGLLELASDWAAVRQL